MTETEIDVLIVGGGIVGLGIGVGLLRARPGLKVVVLESEQRLAMHGSGRNSGVLHSGFYYSPDSLKAKLTRRGNELFRKMCSDEGVSLRECGKVVVARNDLELSQLHELHRRAVASGSSQKHTSSRLSTRPHSPKSFLTTLPRKSGQRLGRKTTGYESLSMDLEVEIKPPEPVNADLQHKKTKFGKRESKKANSVQIPCADINSPVLFKNTT